MPAIATGILFLLIGLALAVGGGWLLMPWVTRRLPVRPVMFGTPVYLAFTSRMIPRDDPDRRLVTREGLGLGENFGAAYAAELNPFVSPPGLPCQAPPWGHVAGADLRTGAVAWQRHNGTVRDRPPVPLPFRMGVPDLGGPVITAGGLAFISGTIDCCVRADDVTTGAQLWEDRLPAGDSVIAYALPPS